MALWLAILIVLGAAAVAYLAFALLHRRLRGPLIVESPRGAGIDRRPSDLAK